MPRQPLIYVGRCLPTNKVYVGSSIVGQRRVFSHTRDLTKGRHTNKYLQRAWNKYGPEAFIWTIVEECDPTDLLGREQWWIGFLRSADRRYGFNLCFPVADNREAICSQLAKSQIEKWRDPEIRRKRLVGLKKVHQDQEWKSRRAQTMSKHWQDPEWRQKMLKVLSKNTSDLQQRMIDEPEFKKRRMRGIQPKTQ